MVSLRAPWIGPVGATLDARWWLFRRLEIGRFCTRGFCEALGICGLCEVDPWDECEGLGSGL